MNSPHTRCRGYVPASTTVTGTSRWRNPIPRVNPASPPPTMVIALAIPFRDKTMTEHAGGFFAELPFASARPERGKFAIQKSRADTRGRVVARHGVATHEAHAARGRQR